MIVSFVFLVRWVWRSRWDWDLWHSHYAPSSSDLWVLALTHVVWVWVYREFCFACSHRRRVTSRQMSAHCTVRRRQEEDEPPPSSTRHKLCLFILITTRFDIYGWINFSLFSHVFYFDHFISYINYHKSHIRFLYFSIIIIIIFLISHK